MSPVLIMLISGVVGFFIGRNLEASHEAHDRFNSYRERTFRNLSVWVRGTTRTTLELAAVATGIYLLFALYIL